MSRKKNLAALQIRKPASVEAFIHGDDVEIAATPKVPEAVVARVAEPEAAAPKAVSDITPAPESGISQTPAPPKASAEKQAVPAAQPVASDSVEVSVQDYEAQGALYQRTDGLTKRRRVVYLPLALDRELAAFCGANGRKVSAAVALFIREGLERHR